MGSIFSCSVSLDSVISQTCNHIALQVSHITSLADRLRTLRTALQELVAARNDVQRRVDIAERGGHLKRLDQVQVWLSAMDALITEVHALIEAATQENNNKCLGGCCPRNCTSTYKLGKKMAKKKVQILALISKGQFDAVAERLPLVPVNIRPSEPLVGFESLSERVWRFLEDEQVSIIGLYGMGGVGKTALLTQIHNTLASSPHDFDHLIWANVSRNQSLEGIQEKIGKKIGLDEPAWASKSMEEKYEDISRVLHGKKFVLLLDNLWERLDLSKAGVPLPSEQNGSKIVFTTRSEIVCAQMDAEKKIKLECLGPTEAWELFRKKVGDDSINRHPDIPELAKIVAKECGGLPLALITLGRATACKKSPQEWSHVITTLKKSALEFPGMDVAVLPLLKFSYDSLPSETLKTCLLRLALYPENAAINQRRLIGQWFEEGLLGEHVGIEEFENHGYDVIGTLISMCLLEVVPEDDKRVRLHDVIRDMVLWIACACGKEKEKYLVEAGLGLTEVPGVGKWRLAKVISLTNNNIEGVTEEPSCPNLEALYLGHNCLKEIAHGFFQFMPILRVLDLSHNESLTELPSDICTLISLEYLNLGFTGIRQLPFELRNLAQLKVLDLTCTTQLDVIPHRVISSLSNLQSLRMGGCGSTNQSVENNILKDGNESLIEELGCLRRLIAIDLTIKSITALHMFLSIEKLVVCTRILFIEHIKGGFTCLNISFIEISRHLQWLCINNCENLRVLSVYDNVIERIEEFPSGSLHSSRMRKTPCFKNLLVLDIRSCPGLKDLNMVTFAPNLEMIQIYFCDGMENVIGQDDDPLVGEALNGETQIQLSNLRELWLVGLPQLKSIYSGTLPFPRLNKILIRNCPNLKRLPVDSSRPDAKIKVWAEEGWWNELQWDNEATATAFVPQFDIATFKV
ncbi:hypothetical protein Nepgr_002923 [Nepenthes gracilis]|uniref:AAA+ ATPase domain-containing protein n=1 Tax=Nepenthes gracilis TaxID=150966 RepID=A0AAD3RY43_NEPGR|nr:hypothetical protein Nepgr_002923 [Nepenthes gracilis]